MTFNYPLPLGWNLATSPTSKQATAKTRGSPDVLRISLNELKKLNKYLNEMLT